MELLILVIFIFLIGRLAVSVYNFHSNPRLFVKQNAGSELVSILIPARNEAANLPIILNSILRTQGVQYEIIVMDDHSEDGTYRIASEYASGHATIRVLKSKALKAGWTGKNYCCGQLAEAARGEYLLFVDADVCLDPLLLSSALYRLKDQDLSLLSLFSKQNMLSLGERSTVPLMHYLLLTLLPLKLILKHPFAIFSAACGQFMLFKAEEYRRYRWHERLRGRVAEDLGIMKAVKEMGLRGEALMSNGLISCRMYRSFGEAIMGFSKNFIAPFDYRLSLFIPFVCLLLLGPLLVIYQGDHFQIFSMLLLILMIRIYTSKLAGEDWWINVMLHPLQMLSFLVISGMAVQQYLFKSSNWKGRIVASLPVSN